MRPLIVMVGLCLVVAAGPASAQKQVEFQVGPVVGVFFGDTRFTINIESELDGSTYGLGSELVFPLDMTKVGAQGGVRVWSGGHRLWTGDLKVLFAAGDPSTKMTDKDWITTEGYRWEFSSTESPVEGSATELELKGTRLICATPRFELAILAGFSYQRITQRMMGFEGWQRWYDDEGDLYVALVSYDRLSLTYEMRCVRPLIGIVPRIVNGPFAAEVQAIISPLTYVKDIDDHVLRHFQIRTDGRGFGYGGNLNMRYGQSADQGARPFVCLSGDLFRIKLDTDGYREYYADNADEGAVAGDIAAEAHQIETTQYGVQLSVGVAF